MRGDANGDNRMDLADPIFAIGFLFLGRRSPECLDAMDANDDGKADLADPIRMLGFIFLGRAAPPAPYPDPSTDPTDDNIKCEV